MNEEQAKQIIALLKSIDSRLSQIERHVSVIDNLDDVMKELKEVNTNIQLLQP